MTSQVGLELQDFAEGSQQVPDAHHLLGRRFVLGGLRLIKGPPQRSGVLGLHAAQLFRHHLETPVFHQLAHQLFTIEVELLGFQISLFLAGKQLTGLQGQELCRHHQVLAGDAQFRRLRGAQELHVLVGDLGHADGARIKLLVVHQIEQQV